MTDHKPLTTQQLADIEAAIVAYQRHAPTGFSCCTAHPVADVGAALLAEVRRLQARVAEVERPAVEAKRNEIRGSFVELAAAAQEDRDFEGAFNVECDLRKREEQWAAEDAPAAAGESGSTR